MIFAADIGTKKVKSPLNSSTVVPALTFTRDKLTEAVELLSIESDSSFLTNMEDIGVIWKRTVQNYSKIRTFYNLEEHHIKQILWERMQFLSIKCWSN